MNALHQRDEICQRSISSGSTRGWAKYCLFRLLIDRDTTGPAGWGRVTFQDQFTRTTKPRGSPSGSFTIPLWLSKTIVRSWSGSDGVHIKPGWLGLPVRAKLAHAVAIFLASACASGVLPVPCSHRLVLSKQKQARSCAMRRQRRRALAIAM